MLQICIRERCGLSILPCESDWPIIEQRTYVAYF